jgi:hypothetical protein
MRTPIFALLGLLAALLLSGCQSGTDAKPAEGASATGKAGAPATTAQPMARPGADPSKIIGSKLGN